MIDFSELKVYKRELLTDSPYTDRYMMIGNNERKEKLDTMENKLHRMFLDSDREFRPSFTHLILSLDMKGHVSNAKLTLLVGSAGYCWVPRNKLKLDDNETLNNRLLNILKGYVMYYNEMESRRTNSKYQRLYDLNNVEPLIYRNREGVLCVTWINKEEKANG